MTITGTTAWLLLQAVPAAGVDTLFTKQVDPGWFQKATGIASGLMTIALLVLTVALVPAAWNFRKSYARINKLLERVYGDINPIVRHTHAIADNVDYITTSIRTDVQQVNATIAAANQRLHQAVMLAEARLAAFNALLDVAQQEAERAFVNSAATVRGVRAGAAQLREDVEASLAGRRTRGAYDDVDDVGGLEDIDELDDIDETAGGVADASGLRDEEEAHGDEFDGAAGPGPARPRVRPRGPRGRRV